MSPELLSVLVLACGLLALGFGWFVWGRPLSAARGELAERRESLGRALAEVAAFKAQAEEARPFVARAADLQAALAAADSAAAERERALAEALAERDRVHARQLEEMRGAFQRLAAETLEQAQVQFLARSEETLKRHREEAARGLADSRTALSDLVAPMKETLGRYGEELRQLEQKREQAYGSLSEQLQALTRSEQLVREEAGRIVAALRGSARASGSWGEAQLKRVLEMAGLAEGIAFDLQASEADEEGRQKRPDAILHLPGGRQLIVDSKCAMDDYVAAADAATDEARAQARARHARRVREHVKGLAAKAYWDQFGKAADFVIMFIPGENFLSAALEEDMDLHLWAMNQKILLVGPTNLLAIARVVASVWRQERVAEEAKEIGRLGAELYERLARMTDHANRVGRNLDEAAKAWNQFIGSYESRVLVTGRRFEELGVVKEPGALSQPRRVETSLRLVQAPELRQADGGPGTD
jgi:DNA recombination protein RmuC